MIVVVCGSRSWADVDAIRDRLSTLDTATLIVHGGAPGADTIAGNIAYRTGFHVATIPALWHVHGKAAGAVRNLVMLSLEPGLVLAFSHGTSGTQDTIDEARRRGIAVEVHGREAG